MSSVIFCVLCSLTVWRLCVRCGRRGVAAWWRPSPWAPSSLLPTAPPPCYCSAAAGPPEGGDRTKTSWEDAARTLQTHQSAERRHRAALQVSVRSSCRGTPEMIPDVWQQPGESQPSECKQEVTPGAVIHLDRSRVTEKLHVNTYEVCIKWVFRVSSKLTDRIWSVKFHC